VKILGAPTRYIQGRDVLDRIGDFIALIGKRVFVFGDDLVLGIVRDRMTDSLKVHGVEPIFESFGGECSWGEIRRLRSSAERAAARVIVGAGGGKAADTAKVLNIEMGLPIAIVPTIAATDAPTSHIAAIYDDQHAIQEVVRIKPSVVLVLVDTGIIAQAPVRYLVAGMGDALSTKFEAEACWASGASNMFGGQSSLAALQLSRLAYDVIRQHGEEAKRSAEQRCVTPALEQVVEANILLSGLGFESGGLAAAHALHAGFTLIEEMNGSMHGEKVAFGVLVQMVLEEREPAFLEDLLGFYRTVGLPTNLADLGLKEKNITKLDKAAERACREGSYIYNMPFPIDKRMVIDAIIKADAIGSCP
jgi:glycerol dehydrogenase